MRAPSHRYTWQDYLLIDEDSPTIKHEFFDGEIYAMAGGTPGHERRAMNIGAALHTQLRGKPCGVYSSDLRIRVQATGLGTYPDVSVICGEPRVDTEVKGNETTVLNPKLLVEVLSDSTEAYDRGAKFDHYRRIPSLETYVLVSQHERLIEVFSRAEGEWIRTEARTGASAKLESIDCVLSVDEVYEGAPPEG